MCRVAHGATCDFFSFPSQMGDSQEEYRRVVDFVDEYLDTSFRYQSASVLDDIFPDIQRLYSCYVTEERESLIEEQITFLRRYFHGACISPREYLNFFPLIHYRTNYEELTADLQRLESRSGAKSYLKTHQFRWALETVAKWVDTSVVVWEIELERFIHQEADVVLFLQILHDYLTSYHQNQNNYFAHAVNLKKIGFDSLGNPLSQDFKFFLSQVENRLNHPSHHRELNLREKVTYLKSLNGIRSVHIQKINLQLEMYYAPLEVRVITRGTISELVVSKPVLLLSEALKACHYHQHIESSTGEFLNHQLTLRADVVLYLDCDVENSTFHGISLVIQAPKVVVISNININLSGQNGKNSNRPQKAGRKSGSLDGEDGEDADHGEAGESGGNLYLVAQEIENISGLNIISNGGKGGVGGEGGEGGDGGDGYDGQEGQPEVPKMVSFSTWGLRKLAYAVVAKGSKGTAGGVGGNGGGAGRGGFGGYPGLIKIEIFSSVDDASAIMDRCQLESGQDGEDSASMGRGGSGGKPGKDGIDVCLYQKKGWDSNPQLLRNEYEKEGLHDSVHDAWLALPIGGGFISCDPPSPFRTEEEFCQFQQQKQQEHQRKNKGKDSTKFSDKPRVSATHKAAIHRAAVNSNYLQNVQNHIQQKTLFVTTSMIKYFQNLGLNVENIDADDGVDESFLARLNGLQSAAAELRESIQAHVSSVQQSQEVNANIERVIELGEDDIVPVSEGNINDGKVALFDQSSEPFVPDMTFFYDVRKRLVVYLSEEPSLPDELVTRVAERFTLCKYILTAGVGEDFVFDESSWVEILVSCFIKKASQTGIEALYNIVNKEYPSNWLLALSDRRDLVDRIRAWTPEMKDIDVSLPFLTADSFINCGISVSSSQQIIQHLADSTHKVLTWIPHLKCYSVHFVNLSNYFRKVEDNSRNSFMERYLQRKGDELKTGVDQGIIQEIRHAGCLSYNFSLPSDDANARLPPELMEMAINRAGDFEFTITAENLDEIWNKEAEAEYMREAPPLRPIDSVIIGPVVKNLLFHTPSIETCLQLIMSSNAKLLLLYILDKFISSVKLHDKDSWHHYHRILVLLGQVDDAAPLLKSLLVKSVSLWPLELESYCLYETIASLCNFNNRTEVTQSLYLLDRIESHFGRGIRIDLENVLLDKLKQSSNQQLNDQISSEIDDGLEHKSSTEMGSSEDLCQMLKLINATMDDFLSEKFILDAAAVDLMRHNDVCLWRDSLLNLKDKDVGSRSLDKLILLARSNPKNEGIGSEDWDLLREDIIAINRCYEKSFTTFTYDSTRRFYLAHQAKIKECLSQPTYESKKMYPEGIFYKTFGMLCAALRVCEGHIPRNTQLLAALISVKDADRKGSLLEVATGEGKTMIVVILTLLKVMQGLKVDVITSSPVLARRDCEENSPIFNLFHVTVGHNCDTSEEMRRGNYERHVVYGDVGSFERDYLLDKFYSKNIRGGREWSHLAAIVDEVDSMLLDRGDHMLYLSQAIPGMEHLEAVFVNIWIAVHGADMQRGSEKDVQTVVEFIRWKISDGSISYPKYFHDFVENRLQTWVESAFIARGQLDVNDSYRIGSKSKDVVTMDKNTGVQMINSHLSDGIHQFLQLKHLQRFTPESLKSIFVSNTTYFKKYNTLSGLSGTLGSEAEKRLLADVYGVDVICIPTFKPRCFTSLPSQVANSKKEHLNLLVASLKRMVDIHRPVLIVNDNIAAVQELAEYLSSRFPKVRSYFLDDAAMNENMMAGEIVISTNLAGRGTDIKISDEVARNGGLHVILTYCPNNLRIERQAFGRAGRKGQQGSGEFIVLLPNAEPVRSLDIPIYRRNQIEKYRLWQLRSYKIHQIRLEEDLLEQFRREVLSKIEDADSFVKEQKVAYGLERFAFWLDSQKESLLCAKHGNDDILTKSTSTFISMRGTLHHYQNNHYDFIIGKYWFHKGFSAKDEEDKRTFYSKAKSCFQSAISQDASFSEFADYYLAGATIQYDHNDYRDSVICLKRARHKILKRSDIISCFPKIIRQVMEFQQSSGESISSDLYSKQIENRLEIYNTFLGSISAAIGSDQIDISALTSAYCNDKQAKKFQDAILRSERFYSPHHSIIPEFYYSHAAIKEKLPSDAYTESLKNLIAEKVLSHRYNINSQVFESMLPNVDDLFQLLESHGIFSSTSADFRNIKEYLCAPLRDVLRQKSLSVGDILSFEGKLCPVVEVSDNFDYCVVEKAKTYNTHSKLLLKLTYSDQDDTLTSQRLPIRNEPRLVQAEENCMVWFREVDVSLLTDGDFRVTEGNNSEPLPGKLHSLEIEIESGVYSFQFSSQGSDTAGAQVVIQFDFLTGLLLKFQNRSESLSLTSVLQCRECSFCTVRSDCQAPIEMLFAQPVFQNKYVGLDNLKNLLLAESSQLDESRKMKIKKNQIGLLNREQAAGKLIGILETEKVIRPPDLKQWINSCSTDTLRHELRSCLGGIIEKEGVQHPEKLLDDFVKIFDLFKEQRKSSLDDMASEAWSEGKLTVVLSSVRDNLQDGLNFSLLDEVKDMEHRGVDAILSFKNEPHWWGPWVVLILGVVQIVAGAVITAMGFPNIGMALIAEGVGDIIFALEAFISGNFSWKAYLTNKLISLAISIITCGIGSVVTSRAGVQIAKACFRTIVKKVGKKLLESAATALSGIVIDGLLDKFFDEIVNILVQKADVLRAPFEFVAKRLKEFYAKVRDKRVVNTFIKELSENYFSTEKMLADVSRYMHQVLGAIAAGLANAGKILQHQGGKFRAVAEAAKAFQVLLKTAKYAECIAKAFTEYSIFLTSISSKIELKTREAVCRQETHSQSDDQFIEDVVKGWKEELQTRFVNHLKDGILKPEIKNGVNGYLRKVGRAIKQEIGIAGKLEDKTYKKNLQDVRTRNLSALASLDRTFSKSASQCPAEIIGKNKLETAVNLPDEMTLSNSDGHTVGSIKEMIPGVVFYQVGPDKFILLPPDLNKAPLSKMATDELYRGTVHDLKAHQFKIQEGAAGEPDHMVPVVDGQEINLSPIAGCCNEQTRLFWDKLSRLDKKYGDSMSKQEKIVRAKMYAEKEHKVVKLRYHALTNLPGVFRNNDSLRRMVGSVGDSKVGYVSMEVYLYASLAQYRNNFSKNQTVDGIRHANELGKWNCINPYRDPQEDRSELAATHLQTNTQEIRSTIIDILEGRAGTDEERIHLRACAGLFNRSNGEPVSDAQSRKILQSIKHVNDQSKPQIAQKNMTKLVQHYGEDNMTPDRRIDTLKSHLDSLPQTRVETILVEICPPTSGANSHPNSDRMEED